MVVKVYSVPWCGPCQILKNYLYDNGIDYEEVTVPGLKEDREEVMRVSGQYTVPVITIDDQVIIGFAQDEIDRALGLPRT